MIKLWQHLQRWIGVHSSQTITINPDRWVVLDCESTGLNPHKDKLLSIAAVAVVRSQGKWQVSFAEVFEVIIEHRSHHPKSSRHLNKLKENILVHGIGVDARQGGMPLAKALHQFWNFVGDSPCLAYHSGFDQALLETHTQLAFGKKIIRPWLDIEHLIAVLHHDTRRHPLDYWLKHYKIHCAKRHNASADTFATAELLLKLFQPIEAKGIMDWDSWVRFAGQVRHMAGR